jgi:hypothetical protein
MAEVTPVWQPVQDGNAGGGIAVPWQVTQVTELALCTDVDQAIKDEFAAAAVVKLWQPAHCNLKAVWMLFVTTTETVSDTAPCVSWKT